MGKVKEKVEDIKDVVMLNRFISRYNWFEGSLMRFRYILSYVVIRIK